MGSSSLWMTLLLPSLFLAAVLSARAETPGCQDSCGGVDIPYPFGIGAGCFRDGFEIECLNNTMPVMVRTSQTIRVLNLSVAPRAEIRVMLPVAWQCFNSTGHLTGSFGGQVNVNPNSVYRISNTHNDLVILGCNTFAYINSGVGARYKYQYYTGCVAFSNDSRSAQDGACAGVGCCRVDIPPGLTDNVVSFSSGGTWSHADQEFCPCDYAFIVEKDYYNFRVADLHMDGNRSSMPLSLDWAIRDNGSLSCAAAAKKPGYACLSARSKCVDSTNGPGYTCNCTKGYEGNPYVTNGCTNIDECARPYEYPCVGVCKDIQGSYECTCPPGYASIDPRTESCIQKFPLAIKILIGAIAVILVMAFWVLYLVLTKKKRMAREFYMKHGGHMLESAKVIKVFKKKELKQILDCTNPIGKGAFGEVYKGVLDEKTVAVKKPISGSTRENKQFANEVIIQSHINHKNIVRLIGCCVEVDSPMLVYEFISRGSMDEILHNKRERLNLDVRLRILVESANGLAYMHSQTNDTILHGDVKPANILLDENFVPKISDFGISRLIAVGEEQTPYIIGDMTYMDPEYKRTGILTEKSDVYSFGFVIFELISRKKATYSDNNSLVESFLECHREKKKATKLFDKEIASAGEMDFLDRLAEIAIECLNPDENKGPSMTDVAQSLLVLNKSHKLQAGL